MNTEQDERELLEYEERMHKEREEQKYHLHNNPIDYCNQM